MIERDWHSCYSKGWTGIITPDAFQHPAKFSRGLIRRIYDHLFEQGYLGEGDTVVDPFGGVALGALHAMQHGCHWIGCELEQKFVDLGNQNIELWLATYAPHFPRWGSAVLVQGDSRDLVKVVGGVVGASVSSPPFAGTSGGKGKASQNAIDPALFKRHLGSMIGAMETNGNLGNLRATSADHATAVQAAVSSPPYASDTVHGGSGIDPSRFAEPERAGHNAQALVLDDYGRTEGQLGAMPAGDLQAVVSSPPYTVSLASDDPDKRGGLFRDPKRRNDKTLTAEYGKSEGQLGAMREGDFDAMVTSPPYEESLHTADEGDARIRESYPGWHSTGKSGYNRKYGVSDGQLGQETGNTFWAAARTIIEQTHQTLAPGAVAVWVCKSFVRNKKRVDFPGQWRELCEACGFETIEMIRAWLVEDRGAQYTLTGELDERTIERKSFFRRKYEFTARAEKFWNESMDRDAKAKYLWLSHNALWEYYLLSVELAKRTDEEPEAPYPTRGRILYSAQKVAYIEAGKPDIEIDTSIDYEVVIIQRRI